MQRRQESSPITRLDNSATDEETFLNSDASCALETRQILFSLLLLRRELFALLKESLGKDDEEGGISTLDKMIILGNAPQRDVQVEMLYFFLQFLQLEGVDVPMLQMAEPAEAENVPRLARLIFFWV